MNFSRIINIIFLILFCLGIYFKYPHINPDGLLYIDNAIKFNGNFENLSFIYGLPAYPIIIYFIGSVFDSYYLAVYLINLICFSIIIYTLIKLTNLLIINKHVNEIIVLLFLTSSLMSSYLGLTIRDYLGWTFLILSFYYSIKFSYSSKNKYLFLSGINLFFGSFFRLELLIYLFIIPIYLYLRFTNSVKLKIYSFILIIFLSLILCSLFYYLNDRFSEIINHGINFFESIKNIIISDVLYALLFILKKLINIIPYFFYLLTAIFFYYKYYRETTFISIKYKEEYTQCFTLYFLITFVLGFIYYLNSGVFSSRYFIGILLITFPIFSYFFITIYSKIKNIRKFLIFFLILNITLNVNSNSKYLNDAEKNVANFLTTKGIDAQLVYIVDNRILFYMGYLTIIEKKVKNIKYLKKYKYFVFKDKELDEVNHHINDSCYNLNEIPETNKKYYFVEKKDSC